MLCRIGFAKQAAGAADLKGKDCWFVNLRRFAGFASGVPCWRTFATSVARMRYLVVHVLPQGIVKSMEHGLCLVAVRTRSMAWPSECHRQVRAPYLGLGWPTAMVVNKFVRNSVKDGRSTTTMSLKPTYYPCDYSNRNKDGQLLDSSRCYALLVRGLTQR